MAQKFRVEEYQIERVVTAIRWPFLVLLAKCLEQNKIVGVQISLDDFGTGYSSLHYFHEFPIDKIKIDQSFIRNCTSNLNNAPIVKMIIAMAHHLKIKAVVEEIEMRDELIFLQQNSCNHAQGYFFSMPLPPKELVHYFYVIAQIVSQKGISPALNNPKDVSSSKNNNLGGVI